MVEYTPVLSAEASRQNRFYELTQKMVHNPGAILRAPEKIKDYLGWPKVYGLIDSYAAAKKGPFNFVQIGANDGVRHDPIHSRIISGGWHGVLVEPEPNQFVALQTNYAASEGLTFVNAAITSHDGQIILNRFTDERGVESHSVNQTAFDKSAELLGLRDTIKNSDRISVPSLKLQSLIETTGLGDIDLIAIDAEGSDREIVNDLLALKINPTFVLYEHLMMSKGDRAKMAEAFTDQGYKLITLKQDTFAYRLSFLS